MNVNNLAEELDVNDPVDALIFKGMGKIQEEAVEELENKLYRMISVGNNQLEPRTNRRSNQDSAERD